MTNKLENTDIYKKLKQQTEQMSSIVLSRDRLTLTLGQGVTLAYIYQAIAVNKFQVEDIERYIMEIVRENKELRNCFYDTLATIV